MLKLLLTLLLINSFLWSKNVLVVGDSMVEAIYKPIGKMFKLNDINCSFEFKRGTRLDYWIKNPVLANYERNKPDLVIISLGTNDLVSKKTNTRIINEFESLISIFENMGVPRKNILIVATPIVNDNNLNNELKSHFNTQVFDSKEMNLVFSKDGIHPTMESDLVWAASIFDYIATNKTYLDALLHTNTFTKITMK